MNRFDELLSHIQNVKPNMNGKRGMYIKATEHSKLYNQTYPNHNDLKGWKWFKEIMQEFSRGRILIYKQPNGHNWFVLPQFKSDFEKDHPNYFVKINWKSK